MLCSISDLYAHIYFREIGLIFCAERLEVQVGSCWTSFSQCYKKIKIEVVLETPKDVLSVYIAATSLINILLTIWLRT